MKAKQTPSQFFTKAKKYFKKLFPKSSNKSSPWLIYLLNNFESSLSYRLKKLMSQNKDEILTLPWMILAMESLCDTHNDINNLITNLKHCDMIDFEHDQYWIDHYMDITLKLLDLCNAFSSELNRVNHCLFGLKLLRNSIDSTCGEQCIEIGSMLDSWRQNITAKNKNIFTVLEEIVESLSFPPKIKNSFKAKMFMKAFNAANVFAIYICSVFFKVLSNSDNFFLEISTSKQSLWDKAFLDLQTIVNNQIKDALSSHGTMVLKELECVDDKVKNVLYLIAQDGDDDDDLVRETFKDYVVKLKEEVEKLDDGFDKLLEKVHNLFSVTLQGRNTIV